MSNPSSLAKAVARHTAAAFNGRPQVSRYWDDNHASFIDILRCQDSPWEGVTAYGTVGLSELTLSVDSKPLENRVEILGACDAKCESFPNILATAAFCVVNSKWDIAPGVIFPEALKMYQASSTLDSLLFLPPFLWGEGFRSGMMEGVRVAWLMAVPISRAEEQFALDRGVPALEDVFEDRQINVFDLNRPSVV